jgi:glycosyltransferase involved in cell wall biosynthesis
VNLRPAELSSPSRYDVAFYTPALGPLLVREHLPPTAGAETQVFLLARSLARRGVRVAIVVCEVDGAELPGHVDGVDVLARPAYRAGGGRLARAREALAIARALLGVDTRFVVARGAGPSAGIVALSARALRRRFVYSSSGDYDLGRLETKRSNRGLVRLALRLADQIVVQNQSQQQFCEELMGRTPLVIRSVSESAPQRAASPDAFLWIGRAISYKRPLEYLELAKALPEARFSMIAAPVHIRTSADLTSVVAREARAIPNVELLEPRPRDCVLELVERAVAIVNTSEFEGMPNTFLEGWSRGVPALAFSHDPDGVVERYGLGEFAHGSRAGLIAAARRLWEGRDSQHALAERCRRYTAEHHSDEVVSAQWAGVLALGVERGKPAPVRVEVA